MTKKKLIEFGWDEPDTRFLRQHIQGIETTPFDGCVFHANYEHPDGGGNFTWEGWGDRAFTDVELASALQDLQATPFSSFTHSFLRFNVTPGNVDWFDDFSAILTNAALAARIAKRANVAGILFDIEQYNTALFDYAVLGKAKPKSWQAYAKQVRKRGREVMDAFQSAYSDITVFLTFGYCLPWAQINRSGKQLSEMSYGLLAPFLDGLVDAANGTSILVDGHEASYGYRDVEQFPAAYQRMAQDLLPIVANPEKYQRVFRLGFGVWMDNGWRDHGWNTEDFSSNYYSPDAFRQSLEAALEATDEYVWIYTEQPRWWSRSGGNERLPQAYVDAVWDARRSAIGD